MEDRTTPATASLVGSTLNINFTAASDQVTASFDGSVIQLTGSFVSTPSPFSGVKSIVIQDSGNLSSQKMTFSGTTPFSLPDGLSSGGIESVIFNQAVDAGSGVAGISVTAPLSIAVRGNLTGGKAGVNLLANPTASGTSTYGILVENGAIITTSNDGDTVLNGYSGNTGSGYRTGIILQGGASVSAGGAGKVTITGQGGLNSGPNNLGVSVADNSSIISGGGDITVHGTGGTGQGSGNIGIRLSSTAQISAGGAGAVSLEGVGGTGTGTGNNGVSLTGNAKITTQGGSLNVLATGTTGGSGAAGLALEASNLIDAGGGQVTLTTDSIDTNGAAIVSAGGAVVINPRSAGLPIGVGSADKLTGTLSLGLSSSELASISADSLTIGSANSGSITVYANAKLPSVSNLDLTSAGSINASASTVVLSVDSINLLAGTGIGNILTLRTASANIIANSLAGLVNIANTNSGLTTANLSGSTVNFSTTGALDIAGHTITGDLSVQAQGDITQTGAFTVAGVATFGTTSTSDTILNLPNNFSSIGITGARDVVIRDTGALILNASTIARNFSVFTGGNLSDNGNLAVSGTTTIDSGKFDILLDNSNNFGSLGITAGNNALIRDTGTIDLAASTLTGTLAVNTSGAITQSGPLAIAGAATFNAGSSNDITLNNLANNFSSLSVSSANNVALTDANALILGASTINGTLAVNTSGAITQSGILSIAGAATFNAGSTNDITLNNPANNFSSLSVSSANNVALTDANALVLGASTISGALAVNTSGAITQSGPLAIAGAASFNAGSTNDITLNNPANNFSSLSVSSANNVALTDANALVLGASTISGTLAVNTNGAITQSGPLAIAGAASFNAGSSNDITLNNPANNFSSLSVSSANNVIINDSSALVLAVSTIVGNLDVTTGGNITDTGPISVSGVTTISASGHDITLDNKNDFNSLGITAANNATINDINSLALNACKVSGNLTVTSNGDITDNGPITVGGTASFNAGPGHDLILDNANSFGSLAIPGARNATFNTTGGLVLGACAISGNLTVTTGGDLTDNGPISVGGITTLSALGHDITLDNSNDFNSLAITAANNAFIRDINDLSLDNSSITGNLTITTAGDLSQGGSLTIGGATILDVASHDISFANANNFNSLGINSARDVIVNDINALILNASNITGNLTITTGGDLTDSGALVVSGLVTLDSGSHDITLNDANNFNSVGITKAANALLNDTTGLVINGISVTGNLTISTSGTITQTDVVTVSGTSSFSASAIGDITLDYANDFSSISFPTGRNVEVLDVNSLVLGGGMIGGALNVLANDGITQSAGIRVAGAASLNAGGVISLNQANDFSSVEFFAGDDVTVYDINSVEIRESLVSGAFEVTAAGGISSMRALNVGGTATFTSTAAGNILVTRLSCQGLITADTFQGDATIVNAGTFLISGSVNGKFSLKAISGGISDFGQVAATGGITLEAPGDSHLDQDLAGPGGLTFRGSGTLNVSGQNTFTGPTLLSAGTIVLTGSLASSPVTVSGGLLTGSGSLKSLSVTGGTVTPDLTFDCAPLSLGKGGRLVMQVGGIVPGLNQALVTASSVALSGKLVIAGNPAFQTVMGSRITLINNTGASKVSGQFAGLPEGTQVLVNGMRYFISYRGGAGRNDVVLSRPTIVAASVSNRLVTVFDKDGRPRASILPFGNYLGKATIATGDVTGDGVADVLTGSGVGNRPHVRVFNGVNLGGVHSFFALEPSYRGDVSVAAGDINQDGKADIIAAAGRGDPGLVRVYSGNDLSILKSFFPFGPGFTGGVTVASGDFNHDGVADIVCGTDGNSITTVRIIDGSSGNILMNWRPFPAFSVGVSLAVGDFNGDGRMDVFAGAKAGVNPVVAIMNGATGKTISAFNAFDANYRNGVSVTAVDINGDGMDEVVVTPLGVNFQPVVRIIARAGLRTLRQFTAFQQPGGASVAGWN